MVRIHNTETDQIIDREMTDAEFAQYKADEAQLVAFRKQEATTASAKAALLNRLGMTAEEAALLLQ